uniref:Uncharacterized protein n=1 Tax=Zea mays TaxID=4577 RepID=C4IZ67_MAIZE|nr:unknown [Zea mays]
MSPVTSFGMVSLATMALCTRNLSLQCMSGGASRCACIVTTTSALDRGATMPLFGRTQYFLGLVVLTLNATCLSVLFVSCSVQEICLFNSNGNRRSTGSIPSSSPDSVLILEQKLLRNRTGRNPRWWWERRGGDSEFRCLPSVSLSLCVFFSPSTYIPEAPIPEAVEQRRKRRKTKGRNRGKARDFGRGEKQPWALAATATATATAHRRRGYAEYSCERTRPRDASLRRGG